MQTSVKLGILGGTFDPVHNGHLALAEEAMQALWLDELLFIPAPAPPHKNGRVLTPFAQRYEMVRLAISGRAYFKLSDLEARRQGQSYTYDTLKVLKEQMPDRELFFLTGADALEGFTHWYRWQEILDLCTLVVTSRPGIDFQVPEELESEAARRQNGFLLLEKEEVDISATELRQAIADGSPWQQWVPKAVAEYIQTNHLYRG